MVSLTPAAAEKLKTLLQKEGKPGGLLRVKVLPGGCSGLSVQLDIVAGAEPEDQVFETAGARLAVDPRSLVFLKGSRVDYKWTLMKSGFVVENPNAATSCSCGTSFSVDPSATTFSV